MKSNVFYAFLKDLFLVIWKSKTILFLLAYAALFILGMMSIYMAGPLLMNGNIHDQFIGLLTAKLWINGESFYSPLGPAYTTLSVAVLKLIEFFKVDLNNFFILSGLVYSIVNFFAWCIYRRISYRNKYDYLVLLFIVSWALPGWNISEFKINRLYWYGSYNLQMYSTLFLMLYFNLKQRKESVFSYYSLITLNSFLVILAIFFKVNFSISFFIISLLPFLKREQINFNDVIKNIDIKPLLFYCSLLFVLFYLFAQYLYKKEMNGYFVSLGWALQAKKASSNLEILKILLYSICCYVLIAKESFRNSFRALSNFFRYLDEILITKIAIPILDSKKMLGKKIEIKYALILLAIVFAIIGDYTKPVIMLFLSICFCAVATKPNEIRGKIAVGILVTFSLYSLSAVVYASRFKFEENIKSKYKEVVLNTYLGKMSWVVSAIPPQETIFREKLIDLGIIPKNSFSNHLSQAEYFKSIDEVRENVNVDNAKIATIDFINEFSFRKMHVGSDSFIWIHPGTTVSDKNLEILDNYFFNADLVMIRNYTDSADVSRTLTCHFLKENKKRKKYILKKELHYWTIMEPVKDTSEFEIWKKHEQLEKECF